MKQVLSILLLMNLIGCSKSNNTTGGNISGLTGDVLFSRDYLATLNPQEIYSLNLENGSETQLTNYSDNGTIAKSSHSPSWNHDKTKFVFGSQKEITQIASHSQIYSANANGTSVVKLTNSTSHSFLPKYSPDSKKIAFIRNGVNNTNDVSELYLMNSDGSDETKITDFSVGGTLLYSIKGHCWKGNDKILFVLNKDNSSNSSNDIFEIDLNTLATTRITNNLGINYDLDVSPDGSKILYAYLFGLYTINSDGTGKQKLNIDSEEASWTADGRILFISARESMVGEIYVANADGTNMIRLTNNSKSEHMPRIR